MTPREAAVLCWMLAGLACWCLTLEGVALTLRERRRELRRRELLLRRMARGWSRRLARESQRL